MILLTVRLPTHLEQTKPAPLLNSGISHFRVKCRGDFAVPRSWFSCGIPQVSESNFSQRTDYHGYSTTTSSLNF
jgi:hypothetical protein